MSKKSKDKDKDKSHDVESEISRLCDSVNEAGHSSGSHPVVATTPPGLQDFFTEFLRQQATQHSELLGSLSAVKDQVSQLSTAPQTPPTGTPVQNRPPAQPILPSQLRPPAQPRQLSTSRPHVPVDLPPVPRGLFTYEPDEEDIAYSSEDEYEFEGWDNTQSGQVSAEDASVDISQAPSANAPQDMHPHVSVIQTVSLLIGSPYSEVNIY